MKELIIKLSILIALIAIISSLAYGGWLLSKKVSYIFSYKSMVEQTVREMVKGECLK